MTTALYRISSNEVVKISLSDQQWSDRDPAFWGVLTTASYPDGTAVRDPVGDLRVLGYSKFADVGGNVVRNALQAEIDTFASFQADDENQQDALGAETLFLIHPRFRKLMTAYSDILKDEFNIVRGWLTDFKVEVAAAANLGDLKTRIAALPDLPDRTLAQLKTAITNRINKDD